MIVTIFILFLLYMAACIMDGPDVKPLWKRWLGTKLEIHAHRLKPIHYCRPYECRFYHYAMKAEREAKRQRRVAMEASNAMLHSSYERGEQLKIEDCVCINEFDVMDAQRRYGANAKAFLVEQAKHHITRCVAAAIEKHSLVHFEIRENHYETYVHGNLSVIKE